MRIAIVGVGGVGGYFGGRLAEAGAEVAFIARGAHLQAIREHGLRVSSIEGDFVVAPARATDDPAEVGPVDAVLLGVKSWQVAEAAHAMRPLIGSDTAVVPLLNGVEAPDQLAAVLGEDAVLGGVCGIMAFLDGPGRIRHAGVSRPFVHFGELDNRRTPRVERLLAAFAPARAAHAAIACSSRRPAAPVP
jgi:2-dehydropantoate 2-reductase